MVERIIPCKECRKRRRKCVRASSEDICDRCKRLERECIDSEEEPNYTGYDKELPLLQQQVAQLSFLIDQMEKEAYNLSQLTNRNKNNNDDDSDKQLTAARATNRISKNPNSKPWKLSFSDGMLHIETGIRSINDLMMQFSPIQYLSPLSLSTKNEKDLTFQFSTGNAIRFMPLTIKLLVKCISRSFVSVPFLLPSIDNSPFLSTNINHVADELVRMYFLCRNTYRPMIHERSFMEHYQSLQSPLDSLVSLCICCYVSSTPCNHTAHDSNKFRQLADFFYNLAKTKLMGQFDETEKRLENLVAINLLSDYMHITLQLDDFKNLVTLGHRICMDLEPWYKATEDQGVTVERTLYCRHFTRIYCNQSLLSLITNEPMHHLTTVFPEWLVMYDDSLAVAESIGRQNYLLGLYNHPYLSNIKEQIHYQFKGYPFTLTFETIIELDEVLNMWWRNAPSEYQVCIEWLDLEKCKDAISRCTNGSNLMFFNQFLAFMVDIYSTLLQPKALNNADDQILSVVQELTLRRSIHCSEVLIYSQARTTVLDNPPSCHSVLTINEYLFHSLDALIIMSLSENYTVRTKAQSILKQSQLMIESLPFMQLHRVDYSRSPLMESVRANDLDSLDLSEYYKYPQPWFAMIYDLSHYLDRAQAVNDMPSPISLPS